MRTIQCKHCLCNDNAFESHWRASNIFLASKYRQNESKVVTNSMQARCI
jgi:hypothetical protein